MYDLNLGALPITGLISVRLLVLLQGLPLSVPLVCAIPDEPIQEKLVGQNTLSAQGMIDEMDVNLPICCLAPPVLWLEPLKHPEFLVSISFLPRKSRFPFLPPAKILTVLIRSIRGEHLFPGPPGSRVPCGIEQLGRMTAVMSLRRVVGHRNLIDIDPLPHVP